MKNLKIKAVYKPVQDGPEFNIFREILINFNACEIIIKDVTYDEFSKNLINFNFNENIYKFNNDEIILNLYNIIINYINHEFYNFNNNEIILNNAIECLFYHIISQYGGDDLTFYRIYLDS